jgi:hypothetical protein
MRSIRKIGRALAILTATVPAVLACAQVSAQQVTNWQQGAVLRFGKGRVAQLP